MKLLKLFLVFGIALVQVGCNTNAVYEKYIEIEDQKWNIDDVARFDVAIDDTISIFDVNIHVRNTSRYEMSNLFLFVTTTAPNGAFVKDTFEIYLADERGRWFGKGWGDLYDNKVAYKQNIRFPVSGSYKFEFVQAMRTQELKYISDIGISIEKSTNK